MFAASWIRTVVFSTGVTLGPVKFWFSKMNFISFEMFFETLFFSNYLIQLLRTVEKEANDRLESRLWREGHCAFNNSPLSRLTKTLFEPWIVHFNSSETQKNRTRLCNKITDDHFYYFIGIFWCLEKVSEGLKGTVNEFFHSSEVTWSVSFDRHVTSVHLKFGSV